MGAVLVTASAVAFSTAGLFTRLVAVDAWTVLFWRGLFGGLTVLAYIAWRERRGALGAMTGIGPAGLRIAVCSALATICFINALRLTSVADVLVINATGPFIAAGIAWLTTAERPGHATLVASLAALAGVAVMVGNTTPGAQVAGCLLALAMTVLLAAMVVIMRARSSRSMLPGTCASAFLCAVLVAPAASPLSASVDDLLLLVLFGSTQFGLGMLLLTLGARWIPATRASLIGILDVPLAPLWVWLAFGELPATATIVGGLVVLGAVTADVLAPLLTAGLASERKSEAGRADRTGTAQITHAVPSGQEAGRRR